MAVAKARFCRLALADDGSNDHQAHAGRSCHDEGDRANEGSSKIGSQSQSCAHATGFLLVSELALGQARSLEHRLESDGADFNLHS